MQKKYCNVCGKEFNEWDAQENFSIKKRIGYGSKYDMQDLELDICIDCMDKLIDRCRISPIEGDRLRLVETKEVELE